MVSPQKEHGHLDIANELAEAFCRYFPGYGEGRVLWAILRKTYGWNKKQDAISISQIVELTGLSRRRVIVCLGNLEAKRMIKILRNRARSENEVNRIEIQKNYDLWVVTEKSPYYRKDLQKRRLRYKKSKRRVVTETQGSDGNSQKVVTETEKNGSFPSPTKTTNTKTTRKTTRDEVVIQQFEQARKIYPGTKRGYETEFANFKNKHKDWKGVLPLLQPSIERQIEWRRQSKAANIWVPKWKNFQTWINNRCWEDEIEIESVADTLGCGPCDEEDARRTLKQAALWKDQT